MPFLGVLKAVVAKRFKPAGGQFSIQTETFPADHLHGSEIQRNVTIGGSIVSQNGAGGFLRVGPVEKLCPHLQSGRFWVKPHLFWRGDLLSQNYILLEKARRDRVTYIGLNRFEGIGVEDLIASDHLADTVFEFADKDALAGVAFGVSKAGDF